MLFTLLFVALFVGAWLFLSMLCWIAWSLRRRARGSLWASPFAAVGGVLGGVIVPLAGLDNDLGIGISMLAALIGASLGCWLGFWLWDRFDLAKRFERWGRR